MCPFKITVVTITTVQRRQRAYCFQAFPAYVTLPYAYFYNTIKGVQTTQAEEYATVTNLLDAGTRDAVQVCALSVRMHSVDCCF